MAAPRTQKEKQASKQRSLHMIKSLDPEDDQRTAISKKISWILRRGAKVAGVPMQEDGWVTIDDLKNAEILADLDMAVLMQVIIDSNGKKLRYELKDADGQSLIRAYSKEARRAKDEEGSGPATASKGDKREKIEGLRQSAPAFVPSKPEAVVPSTPSAAPAAAAVAQMANPMSPSAMGMGYANPYFGFLPMMNYMAAMPHQAAAQAQAAAAAAAAMTPQVPPGKFQGCIKSFNSEKGFGFIQCAQTYGKYQRDVFVHKAQLGGLAVGTYVSFTCEVSKQGMPQARDVAPLWGMPPAQVPVAEKGGKGKGKGKGKGEKGEGGKGKGKRDNKGKGKSKDSEQEKEKDGESKDAPAAEAAPAPEAEASPAAEESKPAAEAPAVEASAA